MRHFVYLAIAAAMLFCLVLWGCSGKSSINQQTDGADSTDVISVDSVYSNAEGLVGKKVKVIGVLTDDTLDDKRRVFLRADSDSVVIRVDATASMGGRFFDAIPGRRMLVTGLLQERRVNETYLSMLEKQRRMHTAETEDAFSLEDVMIPDFAVRLDIDTTLPADTVFARAMAYYRAMIEERKKREGKNYLTGVYIDAIKYEFPR